MSPFTPSDERGRLLLVDGHAYAYRAFYAIRSLTSPTGEPTNAIYGFIKMLAKMREAVEPTHLAVIWDGGLAAERKKLLPEYKAQRPSMPEDLDKQISGIQTYLDAANVPSFCQDGVEADDLIATVARMAAQEKYRVIIASSEKDFMQLVSPQIGLLNPNDKTETIWTAEQVHTKTGVSPGQIIDWLSLIGDSVDNIPGVPGVGTKTATEFLQTFGTIDELFRRLPEVKTERLRRNLEASRDLLARNRQLIALNGNLATSIEPEQLRLGNPVAEQLRSLYQSWGFKRLSEELPSNELSQSVLW